MDTQRKIQLAGVYLHSLLEDVVPFWERHAVDRQFGGFLTSLDRDGTVIDTDKGVWQQARFTWLLAELYNNVGPLGGEHVSDQRRAAWLELARHGADFMSEHCFDPSDCRMWFQVTQDGRPLRKRRYVFSESFASIAYGELAKATGSDHDEVKAIETFERFVEHNQRSLGEAKFTNVRPTRGIGFPMIMLATAQELRESIGLADADQLIDEAIEAIRNFHIKEELRCVMETVGTEGEVLDHFEGRTLNPGHAIECAWFILREAQHRQSQELTKLGCQILDYMWERGWDREHGGILYFVDLKNLPIQEYWHDMKFWWPQCEAIIATLWAYLLTGEERYAEWHQQIHDWTHQHFPDGEHGEWFGYLHRDGRLSSALKGGLWKGPFHIPRMQLVCWKLLETNR